MSKVRKNIWFVLRLLFNKIKKGGSDLGTSIFPDLKHYNFPWAPCTSTDTYFPGNKLVSETNKGLKLTIRKADEIILAKCGPETEMLGYEGAMVTTVDKQMNGKTFLYGRFDYHLRMCDDPRVVCAIWWLTKTRMKELNGKMVESILPEIDWPEAGLEDKPNIINLSLLHGVKYNQWGYTIYGSHFTNKKLLTGNFWMEWTPNCLTFGYESHIVAKITKDVPREPMYPIAWIAVPEWSDGLNPGEELEFYIDKFNYTPIPYSTWDIGNPGIYHQLLEKYGK